MPTKTLDEQLTFQEIAVTAELVAVRLEPWEVLTLVKMWGALVKTYREKQSEKPTLTMKAFDAMFPAKAKKKTR